MGDAPNPKSPRPIRGLAELLHVCVWSPVVQAHDVVIIVYVCIYQLFYSDNPSKRSTQPLVIWAIKGARTPEVQTPPLMPTLN